MNTTSMNVTIAARPIAPPEGGLAIVDLLLRDREGFCDHLDEATDLRQIAQVLLITVIAGCAVFGAAMGTYRGGLQLLYAAIKLPLVVLLTAGICGPALSATLRAVGNRSSLLRDLLLVLSSLALGSMVLAALAPVVILTSLSDPGYHSLIMVIVGCCLIGGACGFGLLIKGLKRREGGGLWIAVPLALTVVTLVGAQMAWAMRPYVLRPRTNYVPFVRSVEGGLMDAIQRSTDSARGIYRRDAAPLPERN